MYLNNFSLRIREGKELENGYVELIHNTQYRIVLENGKSVRCDAYLLPKNELKPLASAMGM